MFSTSSSAQIFIQDFSASTDISSYISATPDSGQFSGISNSAEVVSSITNGQLRMVKTANTASYFYRTPSPALSPVPNFIQLKFDFEASNQDQVTSTREIPFYFGANYTSAGVPIATAYCRFGIGISTSLGKFYLKILDNGNTQSADFSVKQTIIFLANNSGSTQSYPAPNGSSETIANDTWEIWVGTTKVFNDVAVKNPDLELGSFKFQYNSTLPNATLDFDNIEFKDLAVSSTPVGQSLTHPHIWVENSEKAVILDKIATQTWATTLFNQYKSRVDGLKNSHKINPATYINTIPGFPGDRTKHNAIMTMGYEASLLYWLTGDEDYGQLAADVLAYYTKNIATITGDVPFYTSGDYLIESREDYTKPPLIYDFVYSFLKKSGTTVYDKDTGTRVPFNFTASETTFKKLADQVFTRGYINSNHSILEAPGALFNLLSIEDDVTRETYFNKFINGTSNQNGLSWMTDVCNQSGVWPEATGYSIGPHRIILELMEIVDRYKPALNVINANKGILENSFFFENYRYPNTANVMSFGDAHRDSLNTTDLLERVLTISDRKGYGTLKTQSLEMLKALYKDAGGYIPKVETQSLEWNNPYYLLWGENIVTTNATPITYNRSINIDYAGIAMQRNSNSADRVESSLMGFTGGAHYVHSHLTGIDMEIYGLGGVLGAMGGDVGATDRDSDIFRNYYRIYAGHNTVIVNGKSKGSGVGAWKADNQLMMSTTKTVAAEPSSLADPIATQFSFSSQVLDDAINNAKQQRVFSVIRTSDNTGYYFDLFRSKSLGTNNFHDYVYHNVGDNVSMYDDTNTPITLNPTTGRYPAVESIYSGSSIFFPGWQYFEDVKTSSATTAAIKATIPMTKQGIRYMHILMPGGESREYTACKGPETLQAPVGYDGLKTPIVAVRQYGEAWNKPFVSIYEPSRNMLGTVKTVENLYSGTKIVGAKVTSLVNGKSIIDYVISNENDNEIFTSNIPQISFTGRFAIIRMEVIGANTKVSLYIGKGQQLTFMGQTITADTNGKAYTNYTNLSTNDYLKSEESISAFPNPTSGIFEINVPNFLENIQIELYDVNSKLLESKTHLVKNGKVQLDISNQTQGVYFVKVNLKKSIMLKIIKK